MTEPTSDSRTADDHSSAAGDSVHRRLERLEIQLAHQQRTTEQLDQVVQELSLELLRLTRQHDRVVKKLEELQQRGSEPYVRQLEDDKPPHY